jgi:hypothetical protein
VNISQGYYKAMTQTRLKQHKNKRPIKRDHWNANLNQNWKKCTY